MAVSRGKAARRVGMVLFLAFMALILFGVLAKRPWPSDATFAVVRWPLWLLFGVCVPLVVLRIALWRQRRVQRGADPAHSAE